MMRHVLILHYLYLWQGIHFWVKVVFYSSARSWLTDSTLSSLAALFLCSTVIHYHLLKTFWAVGCFQILRSNLSVMKFSLERFISRVSICKRNFKLWSAHSRITRKCNANILCPDRNISIAWRTHLCRRNCKGLKQIASIPKGNWSSLWKPLRLNYGKYS